MDRYLTKTHQKTFTRVVDDLLYTGGIISPLVGLPQAIQIFYLHDAGGVSLFSWAAYFFGALGMLIYGIAHKQKPIIFMHCTVLPVYVAIIIGILIYG